MRMSRMYVRPGNIYKEFIIESDSQKVTDSGRVVSNHNGDGSATLKGCLAQASDKDKDNHSIQNHVVTHTIVQKGAAKAKRSDKLVLGERVFYITDIDDAGSLGIATIYYAEERSDVK